jgi:hypothetical protein
MSIGTLVVKVKTADRHLAGTDNDVFFDIGPLGWPLAGPGRNKFERGHIDTFTIPLNEITVLGVTVPVGLTLFEDDIVWLRLQKKGIFGVNGTSDGVDGEWLPEWVELWVDGVLFAHEPVGVWLNVVNDHWVKQIRHVGASTAEVFARTLRLTYNAKLATLDETSAAVGTLFKSRGISGWRPTPIARATAIGRPVRPVPLSTDGLATIDLQLDGIVVGNETFRFDGHSTIRGPRFIRVEYRARMNAWPDASGVYPLPAQGERVRISGSVFWDTDDEWWYEIHPDGPEDVTFPLPEPPDLRLRTSYVYEVERKKKGTYHWEGLSSVPEGFGDRCKPQDFEYLAFFYRTQVRVELISPNPGIVLRWYVDDVPIAPGGSTLTPRPTGHASSLPPLDGTDRNGEQVELTVQLANGILDITNRSNDGNYQLTVRVEADDDALGPIGADTTVFIVGDGFVMDPAYEKTWQMCRAAVVLARGNYRTSPLPIPRYDPQPWSEVRVERLAAIWQALHDAVLETAHVDLAMERDDVVSLTRQIQATLVAYPEAATKIIELLPPRIAKGLSAGSS